MKIEYQNMNFSLFENLVKSVIPISSKLSLVVFRLNYPLSPVLHLIGLICYFTYPDAFP